MTVPSRDVTVPTSYVLCFGLASIPSILTHPIHLKKPRLNHLRYGWHSGNRLLHLWQQEFVLIMPKTDAWLLKNRLYTHHTAAGMLSVTALSRQLTSALRVNPTGIGSLISQKRTPDLFVRTRRKSLHLCSTRRIPPHLSQETVPADLSE